MKQKFFYLFFFALLLVIIVFTAAWLFQKNPQLTNYPFFKSTPLIALLVFWLSFGLPVFGAYFLVYRKHEEEARKKGNIFFALGSSLVVVAVIGLTLNYVSRVDVEPYSYQVNPGIDYIPTDAPQRFLLQKEVEGVVYKIEEDDRLGGLAFTSEGEKTALYTPLAIDKKYLVNFWYDPKTNLLILLDNADGQNVFTYLLKDKKVISKKLIYSASLPGAYGWVSMEDYFPDRQRLLMVTGNTPTSQGAIWWLSTDGSRENYLDYVTGCSNLQYPSYLGDRQKRLYFMDCTQGANNDPIFDSVYVQDPSTGVRETVLTNKNLPNNPIPAGVRFSYDQPNVILFEGSTETYRFDTATKKVEKAQ